jgi:phosphoketolase
MVRAAASHAFRIGVSARSNCSHVAIVQPGVSISLANGDHVMSCNGARIALPMLTAAPFAVVTSRQPGLRLRVVNRSQFCLVL